MTYGYLNAWYALCSDSTTPRTASANTISTITMDEKIQNNKAMIAAIKSEKTDNEKTTEIFVKGMDDDTLDILNQVLENFDYEVIKQYKYSGAYLVKFETVAIADEAIDMLNARDDIKYASPNYIISIG